MKGLSTATVVRQLTAATTASLTAICCGCWMGWPSASIPKIKNQSSGISMSGEEVSWMVAMLDIGNLVSPVPSGYCMNNFGRKKTLICAGLLYLISWILTITAYNSWYLYVARFIAGLGKGITYTTLPIYLGEISSVCIRGALSFLLIVMECSGIVFTSAVGPSVSFKILAVLIAVFPIIFLITFPFMPETPYYLLMRGQGEDALQAFRWLRGDCDQIDGELEDVKECVNMDMRCKGRFVDLVLHVGNRRALTIAVIIVIIKRCMGSASVLSYASTTLPPLGGWFGPSNAVILYSCASLLCGILVSLLVDHWGRRPIMIVSSLSCSVLSGVITIFFYLYVKTNVDMNSLLWIPYVYFIVNGVLNVIVSCVVETLQGELFPTPLRGHATATCTVTFAVITFLVDKMYVTVEINVGVYANFLFYCVSGTFFGIFVRTFLFETKGKSFNEIQKMLCSKVIK